MKFSEILSDALAAVDRGIAGLEHLFGGVAKQAVQAGIADLAGDAAAVGAEVVADPSLVTGAAQREAATQALVARLKAQGVALGEHSIAAAAAAALAAIPQPAVVQPAVLATEADPQP